MTTMQLLVGLASYFPFLRFLSARETRGTVSARYCYSVWMRHLVMAHNNGLKTNPKIVAELGPGDSLGMGFSALLSGAEKYYALDIYKYANVERNLKIFDELVSLFMNKENIPDENEFPNVKPYLNSYKFPEYILTDERLAQSLNEERLLKIRKAIKNIDKENIIKYQVPWNNARVLEKDSVDLVFSQAVLEHVDDLQNTYKAMYLWLKLGGYMSHQVDFKSHGLTTLWNGHWTFSDFSWKLIKGKRHYFLNREPHSTHINLMYKENLKVLFENKVKNESKLKKNNLAEKFRNLSEDDLTTSGAFIIAVKQS